MPASPLPSSDGAAADSAVPERVARAERRTRGGMALMGAAEGREGERRVYKGRSARHDEDVRVKWRRKRGAAVRPAWTPPPPHLRLLRGGLDELAAARRAS